MDFPVVLPILEMAFLVVGASTVSGRTMLFEDQFALVVGTELRAVGQPKVAAQHVDALLAAQAVGFVGDAGHRVHPGDADRDIGGAELGGRGAEAFDEPALLEIALTAVGDHQRDDPTHTGDDGQCDPGDVDRRGLRLAGRGDPSQEPVGSDCQDQTDAQRVADRGK
ncbi:hypothetical protein [Nocardia amamiensis]|uniref:hypothetical protein n=1 Tax=Nocardia amamiensis TaxID=404578 RepID=UPI0033F476F4